MGDAWLPVLILFVLLVLGYLGMWRGWRRRAERHDLPPLVEVPAQRPEAVLESAAGYVGTTVAGDWLDRVVTRGLGLPGGCRLSLSDQGLDVDRAGRGFRIPAHALAGARHERGHAGKVVPPHGLLVVSWRHGQYRLDSGFRLDDQRRHDEWIRVITTMAKENA